MNAPLVKIAVPSPYPVDNPAKMNLPDRSARCTPDAKMGIMSIAKELEANGGKLVLSDMFRSYDMQMQSHMDYVNKKKKAFSPAPGGSLHEAGRAFDIDLSRIHVTLAKFWSIAAKYGFYPIIDSPDPGKSESWHFDCQGSHRIVYEYYKSGKGNNMPAYTAMAASGILSIGVKVDQFKGKEVQAFIQSGLIRLGFEIGNMDGSLGPKTKKALSATGITDVLPLGIASKIEVQLSKKFPQEYVLDKSDVVAQPL